jgi:hypothetical protein
MPAKPFQPESKRCFHIAYAAELIAANKARVSALI